MRCIIYLCDAFMKKYLLVYILVALSAPAFSQKGAGGVLSISDSVVNAEAKEDSVIDELILAKKMPSSDKIRFFSQATRYGLKNLFPQYGYNSSMPYSAQVNSNAPGFTEMYMRQHSKYLLDMKTWGAPYFNIIENILTQYGLPKELKYIAVIESNLQTGAVSNKGAGGPWQFMPGTARQFNLVINNYTDERTDYFKSTNAAAKYLLLLYRQLKDWLLVMAAYNGGAERVLNAERMSGSTNFWNLQQYLPEESRTYVKRFIATHYIMENGSAPGFAGFDGSMNMSNTPSGTLNYSNTNPRDLNKPGISDSEMFALNTERISGYYKAMVIARNLSMDINDFNRFNPNMDALLTRTGNYDLRLPPEKMQSFLAIKYDILNESVNTLLQEKVPDEAVVKYPPVRRTKRNGKRS